MTKLLVNKNLGVMGKCDPVEVWKQAITPEVVQHVKSTNCNVVILCGGQATELSVLRSKVAINNERIYYNELMIGLFNEFKRNNPDINTIGGDMMKIDKSILEDAVVFMNGPYLKGQWEKHIDFVKSGNPKLIVTINPDPTNNRSDDGKRWKQKCIDYGLQERVDVTDSFDVQSGKISAFVLDRDKSVNEDALRPENPNVEELLDSILIEEQESFIIRGHQSVSGYGAESKRLVVKEVSDNKFNVPSIMSCSKNGLIIGYTNKKEIHKKHIDKMNGAFWIINRFFGKNNPDPIYEIDDIKNYNLSYDCLAIKKYKGETLEGFMSVFSSKVYRVAMDILRNGGFDITQGNFMKLKRLDCSRIWLEDEILNELNISHLKEFINEY